MSTSSPSNPSRSHSAPPEVSVHAVWRSTDGTADIGYAVLPQRRRVAMTVVPLLLVVGILVIVIGHPVAWPVTIAAMALSIWLTTRAASAPAGFYELSGSGRPVSYLGTTRPGALSGRTRIRVHAS